MWLKICPNDVSKDEFVKNLTKAIIEVKKRRKRIYNEYRDELFRKKHHPGRRRRKPDK